jgi:hypothetical protein
LDSSDLGGLASSFSYRGAEFMSRHLLTFIF